MDEKLRKIFEEAKAIRPEGNFVARSRSMLFAAPPRPSVWHVIQRGIMEPLTFGATLALASALILILFGGVSRLGGPADTANRELLSEAESLDFQIQLSEAQYFTTSADEVAVFLGELKKPGNQNAPVPKEPLIF